MMIVCIDDHRTMYGVEPMCKVLPIAPSTYYRHIARRKGASKLPARLQKDILLTAHIMRVWNDNHQVYGVRKVLHQLKREGIKIAQCSVARLMKVLG